MEAKYWAEVIKDKIGECQDDYELFKWIDEVVKDIWMSGYVKAQADAAKEQMEAIQNEYKGWIKDERRFNNNRCS